MEICDLCNKEFKTIQGLRGHQNWSHPATRDQDKLMSPEQQLAEYVNSLSETLDSVGEQISILSRQLEAVDSKVNGFQSSMLDKLEEAERAKLEATGRAESTNDELHRWSTGELHQTLKSHWDQADECPDCSKEKADIIAELTAQIAESLKPTGVIKLHSEVVHEAPEALEEAPTKELEVVQEEPATSKVAPEALELKEVVPAEISVEPAKSRWKVVKEPFVTAFMAKGYLKLPADVDEPQVSDETEDEAVALAWEKAGYKVEEIVAVPAPAPAMGKPAEEKPKEDTSLRSVLTKIYGEK